MLIVRKFTVQNWNKKTVFNSGSGALSDYVPAANFVPKSYTDYVF